LSEAFSREAAQDHSLAFQRQDYSATRLVLSREAAQLRGLK
jgi:hypothetical protein